MSMRHALVLLAACAASPALADPARNEAAARSAVEDLLGAGRFELVGQLYDPAYVFHGDDRDYPLADVEANMRGTRAAMPDLAVRVDRVVAAGDLVAVQWSATGTNSVRVGGFPGTGRTIRFGGMAFIRFQGGRMTEEWAVHDNLALLRQLGLLPAQPAI